MGKDQLQQLITYVHFFNYTITTLPQSNRFLSIQLDY